MKKRTRTFSLLLVACTLFSLYATAQVTLSGQVRTRTEYKDGQGAPLPIGAKPAFFTSQRTRLSFGYSTYRLKFGVTAQDVRVWGQDVSTMNRTTTQDLNGLMLHEAWAEIGLTDTVIKNKALSLKIGRQELVYDDQRLLGNLDWLQQGRRHDAALLKYETGDWMLHFGAAFNQNKEAASGTLYNSTPPGNYTANTNGGSMYKSLFFLYTGKKLSKGNASFLFLNDNFSQYHLDGVSTKIYDTSTWSRATTGFYYNNAFDKLLVMASTYYQFGKTSAGQDLSAWLLSGQLGYALSKKFSVFAGADLYSGGTSGATSNAFDPLYGTPHKFAGLIDYFYAASPFGKNGLLDYYAKGKYKASDKFLLSADVHQFNSATDVSGYTQKSLGQEIDLVGSYALTKQIGFEAGYSRYFTTTLLASASVKNIQNAKPSADWAYVMINVKPEVLFK
ncbi:alginate export family protein [Flavisolibacter ginsenosidimutans]|uniref:Alginate export domain-containing protein n=1 Tax=Flavisolibacter ginsenosidimutans TaxID=661481 RepID=A0A5B8UIY5_9BACT|nr:alginate export family protein [Flavisolibacter ginsenosidimutans]QEC56119.1 hypothetical protein FSB75_09515 [Flavisolibacter ginsenosidimutans]